MEIALATVTTYAEEPDELAQISKEGYGGILCIETGGPTPGLGCAGRGIIATFQLLEDMELFEHYKPDVVLYDVLGDVVCGGFAAPIREGYADKVLIVTSGERHFQKRSGCRLWEKCREVMKLFTGKSRERL